MGQVCMVCTHENVSTIDRKIAMGCNLSELAREFNIPYQTLYYHAKNHIAPRLRATYERRLQKNGVDVMRELDDLVIRSRRILDEAEERGHKKIELSAIKELRATVELISRIAFAVQEREAKETVTVEAEESGKGEMIREALKTLSPLEHHVYIALLEKMISGIRETKIPGIDYLLETGKNGEDDLKEHT